MIIKIFAFDRLILKFDIDHLLPASTVIHTKN